MFNTNFDNLLEWLEEINIDLLLVFATKRRCRSLILKYNSEIGAAKIAKIDAIIDDVPPTSLNRSNRP